MSTWLKFASIYWAEHPEYPRTDKGRSQAYSAASTLWKIPENLPYISDLDAYIANIDSQLSGEDILSRLFGYNPIKPSNQQYINKLQSLRKVLVDEKENRKLPKGNIVVQIVAGELLFEMMSRENIFLMNNRIETGNETKNDLDMIDLIGIDEFKGIVDVYSVEYNVEGGGVRHIYNNEFKALYPYLWEKREMLIQFEGQEVKRNFISIMSIDDFDRLDIFEGKHAQSILPSDYIADDIDFLPKDLFPNDWVKLNRLTTPTAEVSNDGVYDYKENRGLASHFEFVQSSVTVIRVYSKDNVTKLALEHRDQQPILTKKRRFNGLLHRTDRFHRYQVMFESNWLAKNYIKDACYYTAMIDTFADKTLKRNRVSEEKADNYRMTYESIYAVLYPDQRFNRDNLAISIVEIDKILNDPKYSMYTVKIHDMNHRIIYIHEGDPHYPTMYLKATDDHYLLLNDNLGLLAKLYIGKKVGDNLYHKKEQRTIEMSCYKPKTNVHQPLMCSDPQYLLLLIDSLDKDCQVIYWGDLIKLYFFLLDNNIEPNITNWTDRLKGFSIKKYKAVISIVPPIKSETIGIKYPKKEDHQLYEDHCNEFRQAFQNQKNKSYYSESYRYVHNGLNRNPIVQGYSPIVKDKLIWQLDARRAYASHAYNLKSVPRFQKNDRFVDYHNEPIYPTFHYIIKPHNYVKAFFTQDIEVVNGKTILHAKKQGYQFDILSVCKHTKEHSVNFEHIFKNLYSSKLDLTHKKNIFNIINGHLNIRKKTFTTALAFSCNEEAKCYKGHPWVLSYNGKTRIIKTTHSTLTYTSGFLPIAFEILCQQRIQLDLMIRAVESKGHQVIAVNTDAIYFQSDTQPSIDLPITSSDDFPANFGTYKLDQVNGIRRNLRESKMTLTKMTFDRPRYNIKPDVYHINEDRMFEFDVKFSVDLEGKVNTDIVPTLSTELKEIVRRANGQLLITGLAGTGKSVLANNITKYLCPDSKNIQFLAPINKRAQTERAHGNLLAQTIHKKLNIRADDIEDSKDKPIKYDMDGYIVDEFHNMTLSIKMAILGMLKSNKPIIATGDIHQLEAVNDIYTKSLNRDEVNIDVANQVFPIQIELLKPKRQQGEEPSDFKFFDICKKLIKMKGQVSEDFIRENFPTRLLIPAHKAYQITDAQHLSHRNDTRREVSSYVHSYKYGKQSSIYDLNNTITADSGIPHGKGFYVSADYTISAISHKNKSLYTLTDIEGKEHKVTPSFLKEHFSSPLCRTVHSFQGSSAGKKIVLHDINKGVSARWFYTGITRCKGFEVYVSVV